MRRDAALRTARRTSLGKLRIVSYGFSMCRNIRPLFNFEPPATPEEVRAAALQYVRKVSGTRRPTGKNTLIFERAVERITDATQELVYS